MNITTAIKKRVFAVFSEFATVEKSYDHFTAAAKDRLEGVFLALKPGDVIATDQTKMKKIATRQRLPSTSVLTIDPIVEIGPGD